MALYLRPIRFAQLPSVSGNFRGCRFPRRRALKTRVAFRRGLPRGQRLRAYVAEQHGVRAEYGVVRKAGSGKVVQLGLKFGERMVEVFTWMQCAFAMRDPPFEFEARGTMHVEMLTRRAGDCRVEAHQVRQGLLVIAAPVTSLKDRGGACGVVSRHVRPKRRQMILPAKEQGKLAEKRQVGAVVVGALHCRFHTADLVRLEAAQVV